MGYHKTPMVNSGMTKIAKPHLGVLHLDHGYYAGANIISSSATSMGSSLP